MTNTRYLVTLALLAGCDLSATGSCETLAPTWHIPVGTETRVTARSLPDGSLVMVATDPLTIDGTTVPIATLFRVDPSGSIATIGAALPDVPVHLALTATGAGVTLLENVITFSETLQVVWNGDAATAASVNAGGQIAYYVGGTARAIHVRTLDGSSIWTADVDPMQSIYNEEIHITPTGDVFLVVGSSIRLEYSSAGFVAQSSLPFYPATIQPDGSVLGVLTNGYDHKIEVGRADANGTVLWRTSLRSEVSSVVLATTGDVLAVREPGKVVRLDSAGREIASHENCASRDAGYGLGLLYADADGYVLHDARGIARYAGP